MTLLPLFPEQDKIGIIGLGFVGSAISKAHEDPFYETTIKIDIDPSKGTTGTYEQLMDCSGVFVCVPSPMSEDGSCNTFMLEAVLNNLRTIGYNNPIISKVTAPPQTYTKWSKVLPNLVYSPEFLTAKNAYLDYLQSDTIVVGGTVKAYLTEAVRIIKQGLKRNDIKVVYSSIEEASLMKYTVNSFLATKVTFMNEVYKVAKHLNIDYNKLCEMVKLDKRIGESHMQVPGPDGEFGFGGMCFPKDTKAMTHFADPIWMPLLRKVIDQNDIDRGL